MAEETAHDIVLRRAFEDPDFRERLLADPAGTWSEVTGVAVPDDVEVVVLENGPKTVHIVLPDPSLSAEDMDAEAIAGGSGAPWWSARPRGLPHCCASATAE